jgi:serine/threonine protein kinase
MHLSASALFSFQAEATTLRTTVASHTALLASCRCQTDRERRILADAPTPADFPIEGDLLGAGCNGMVFRVRCSKPGLPFPERRFALKTCFNLGLSQTSVVRQAFVNEYQALKHWLPSHPNITVFYCDFVAPMSEAIYQQLPVDLQELAWREVDRSGARELRRAQHYVTSLHTRTLKSVLPEFPTGTAVPIGFAIKVLADIASGLLHCQQHFVVHMDIKTDNILIDGPNDAPRAILCDFGCAVRLPDDKMTERAPRDLSNAPLGNAPYRAPEVTNAFIAEQPLSFSMQPSFELGVLGYEVVLGGHPLGDYPTGHGTPVRYDDAIIATIPENLCQDDGLRGLLRRLVVFDAERRETLANATNELLQMARRV